MCVCLVHFLFLLSLDTMPSQAVSQSLLFKTVAPREQHCGQVVRGYKSVLSFHISSSMIQLDQIMTAAV